MLKDFRDFISRGSVIDLAIGVIIGAAFTAIVNSLVNDIIMPLVGVLLGGANFESLAIQFGEASINYGLFIQAVVNFFLIALVIFFALRALVAMEKEFGKEKEAQVEEESAKAEDIQLLTEIRDLLKASRSAAESK
ncbi:MAG: large conductance mechanosensitive channel protein MscL [Anaerolineales bacterium]|jgi:large conductance mechanosensitive channel